MLCALLILVLLSQVHGTNIGRIPTSRKITGGRTCLQKLSQCDTSSQFAASNYSVLYQKQGLVHCSRNNFISRQCLEYYITDANSDYYPEYTPRHERDKDKVYYSVPLIKHYLSLMKDVDHSIHRINKNAEYIAEQPTYMLADIVIDVRCYHSWTVNPFHRHADCLTFIMPAMYSYLSSDLEKNSHVIPDFLARQRNDSHWVDNPDNPDKVHVMFLADESSDHICRAQVYQRSCVFNLHSVLEAKFGNIFTYSCTSTSNYFASANWFRYKGHISVVAREFIYLREQQNPFTSASGYHAPGAGVFSPRNPLFAEYLTSYRQILFNGFCSFCQLKTPPHEFHSVDSHNVILIIARKPSMSRYIPQMGLFVAHIDHAVKRANELNNERQVAGVHYQVDFYYGNENFCATIEKFWKAKVIVAAHGAGIINTIFSRPNSLLIEITPDKIVPEEHGVPWRSNSYVAESVKLSTHVVVVEHDVNATTDRQLQMKSLLNVNGKQIDYISAALLKYLTHTVPSGGDKDQSKLISSLVDL